MNLAYREKFAAIVPNTLYAKLDAATQARVEGLALNYQFTQQELRQFVEWSIDLSMWGETSAEALWRTWSKGAPGETRERKRYLLRRTRQYIADLMDAETVYPPRAGSEVRLRKPAIKSREQENTDKIFGMCPVASEKTVCCNLRTIDAVRNCGFGCSYCSIQSMFTGEQAFFDKNFADKLDRITLDPDRRYHIGTGQSSDSLLWGNKNGLLDRLLDFARKWPNVLLEFKTKSRNIRHLLTADVPRNIVCSWSLNTPAIIANEEHLTATLEQRLSAARQLADRGIRLAFHLHPMIYYQDWRQDYHSLVARLLTSFSSKEVLFVSFGTLTFPKPIVKQIRGYGIPSRILRMPMVTNPEGKFTYPDEIKTSLFQHAYNDFSAWHGEMFFYLCMEQSKHWLETFGWVFDSNEQFEQAFNDSVWRKLHGES